jgi:hypothetical protein
MIAIQPHSIHLKLSTMLLNVKKGLLALTLLAVFVSCKKNAIDYQKGGVDESKVYQKPITYDHKTNKVDRRCY